MTNSETKLFRELLDYIEQQIKKAGGSFTETGSLITLTLNGIHYSFNYSGFNFIYNVQRLTHNPVIETLLK